MKMKRSSLIHECARNKFCAIAIGTKKKKRNRNERKVKKKREKKQRESSHRISNLIIFQTPGRRVVRIRPALVVHVEPEVTRAGAVPTVNLPGCVPY